MNGELSSALRRWVVVKYVDVGFLQNEYVPICHPHSPFHSLPVPTPQVKSHRSLPSSLLRVKMKPPKHFFFNCNVISLWNIFITNKLPGSLNTTMVCDKRIKEITVKRQTAHPPPSICPSNPPFLGPMHSRRRPMQSTSWVFTKDFFFTYAYLTLNE